MTNVEQSKLLPVSPLPRADESTKAESLLDYSMSVGENQARAFSVSVRTGPNRQTEAVSCYGTDGGLMLWASADDVRGNKKV